MAEENTATELTLDQQLEGLKALQDSDGNPPSDAPKDPKSEGAQEKSPVPSPETDSGKKDNDTTEEPAVDPLAKLDAIKDDDEQPEDDGKKGLNPEQAKILEFIPDVQTAQELAQTAQAYQSFTGMLEKGDFKSVEGELKAWNPEVMDGWLEHIYQQNIVQWVDRWIAETEGGKPVAQVNKGMNALQRQIQELKDQLQERKGQETQERTKAEQMKVVNAYLGHIDSLFDQIEFAEADREYVIHAIHQRVADDSKVRDAINGGKPGAVNKIFKDEVRRFAERDKRVTESKALKQELLDKKKAPLAGGTGIMSGQDSLSDDIKQVPKGQEDSWMDQQFAKLAKTLKRK